MEKVRYELDPYNRLVVDTTGDAGSGLPAFRQAIDGRFRLDKNNNLIYQVKAPLPSGRDIPHQVRLKGEWSITDGHKLRFTLNNWGRQTLGDQLTLEGEFLDAGANSLLFSVTTTSRSGTEMTYALDLGGAWKADERNRLTFHIRKEGISSDILTFNCAWEIDKRNKLVYSYETADLATKKRRVHSLELDGYWDIRDRYRISYSFGTGTDSALVFSTSAGIFKEDYIQYELGIGLAGYARPVERSITIFGRWFLKEDVGVVFEVKYADKKTRELVFGADFKLTGKDTVSLRLKCGEDNKDIGATLELSRKIFDGGGEVFLRALVSGREEALYAGAAWQW